MSRLLARIDKWMLLVVLTIQILYGFGVISPTEVKAQVIKDVIDVNSAINNQLPQYNAGVDQSIQDYLCSPTGQGSDLYDCIGKLYRFGIAFGAIAMVFFMVYAGYQY
ncbi:MAG: hypothetical protein R3B41_03350, partial [Candidatus Doudnabacteria bacterium]